VAISSGGISSRTPRKDFEKKEAYLQFAGKKSTKSTRITKKTLIAEKKKKPSHDTWKEKENSGEKSI